jgi:hypothetical protein
VTREEFREGWNLLVVQPWGRRYSTSVKGDKSTAATQQAFYFKRLERYGGDMWKVTCEILGAGDHWPSIDEIRATINASLPSRYQSYRMDGWAEQPEAMIRIQSYCDTNDCTILEGAEAIRPSLIADDADHEDIAYLDQLIANLRAHRASVAVRRQEKAAGR